MLFVGCAHNKRKMVDGRHLEKSNKRSAVAEMGYRLATIDMGRKLEGCAPFEGELGAHVTQCGLRRGLPSYQVAS